MVRAILEGRKTQTRRTDPLLDVIAPGEAAPKLAWLGHRFGFFSQLPDGEKVFSPCRFGGPGDRLFVRERFRLIEGDGSERSEIQYADASFKCLPDDLYSDDPVYGRLIDWTAHHPLAWKPSIHMPRWASRITLEITGVRVERLNEISEEDCWREGIEVLDGDFEGSDICAMAKRIGGSYEDGKPTFAMLWESINGPGSWDLNPWVWVVEFKKTDA
jgi:hypothetical protein